MFPLDSNVLLAIFVIVALFVYVFILRKLEPKMVTLKQITKENPNKTDNRSTEERKNSYKTPQENPSSRTELSCTHEFGYLGTLPKNSKIPDECLGCMQIVKCLAEGRTHH